MNPKPTIRKQVEELFNLPMGYMHYPQYFNALNEAGKITARSMLDLILILIQAMEEMEKQLPKPMI